MLQWQNKNKFWIITLFGTKRRGQIICTMSNEHTSKWIELSCAKHLMDEVVQHRSNRLVSVNWAWNSSIKPYNDALLMIKMFAGQLFCRVSNWKCFMANWAYQWITAWTSKECFYVKYKFIVIGHNEMPMDRLKNSIKIF